MRQTGIVFFSPSLRPSVPAVVRTSSFQLGAVRVMRVKGGFSLFRLYAGTSHRAEPAQISSFLSWLAWILCLWRLFAPEALLCACGIAGQVGSGTTYTEYVRW